MAITINGNGTLTGVAVGGLPDGIVDTDTLADLAVSTGKIAAGAATQAKRTYAGKEIVQHVFAPYGDVNFRHSKSAGNWESSGIHVDITPTNSSNQIIIGGFVSVYSDNTNEHALSIHNGSSLDSVWRTWTANLGSGPWINANFIYQQTAGTTSALTFTLYHARTGGSGNAYLGFYSSPGSTANSASMWAMEVQV